MSLSTTQYGYIVDPMVPFTDDKGKTIKNGFIRVFMAGTSTPVLTYRNYDGATNQEKIELDNSGRVMHNVIGSKGSLYKVVVYDAHHSQETPILTVDKIAVLGASINASGATIVTGLDSVTVQEENFLKATVEGTGVELALDPTKVTSEVSTTSDVVTAAPDYVVPLLEKTGIEDSKKISLANIFKFALDWISRLATTVTSFASGDFIAVSNTTIGTRKMSKDTLLELTAQNALAGNVAPAFDPTRTSGNPYKAGESVAYEGKTYTFKVDHYGHWDASDVEITSLFGKRNYTKDYGFGGEGAEMSNPEGFSVSDFIPVSNGQSINFFYGSSDKYRSMRVYDENKYFVDYYGENENSSERIVTISDASFKYIRFTFVTGCGAYAEVNGTRVWEENPAGVIDDLQKNIDMASNSLMPFELSFIGNGDNFSYGDVFAHVLPGHSYRIYVPYQWEYTSADTSKRKLSIMYKKNQQSAEVVLAYVTVLSDFSEFYDIVVPDDAESSSVLYIGGRSAVGTKSSVYVFDKTIVNDVVSDNIAPEFDSTRTSENPYKAGEKVSRSGRTYEFKVDHYGAWSDSDVKLVSLFGRQNFTKDYGFSWEGAEMPNPEGFSVSDFIPVSNGQSINFFYGSSDKYRSMRVYDENKYFVDYYGEVENSSSRTVTISSSTFKYIRFTFVTGCGAYAEVNGARVWEENPAGAIDDLQSQIKNMSFDEFDQIIKLSRDDLIASCKLGYGNATNKNFQFAVVTDSHGDTLSVGNVVKLANDSDSIDMIFSLGDIVRTNFNDPVVIDEFFEEISKSTKPVMSVVGNHDVGFGYYVGNGCNHQQAYDTFIKPIVDKGWLDEGCYEDGKPYYYKDIDSKKLRIIAVYEYDSDLAIDETHWSLVPYNSTNPMISTTATYNQGDIVNVPNYTDYSFKANETIDMSGATVFNRQKYPSYKFQRGFRMVRQEQAEWLCATLISTPQDYTVVILTHNPFSSVANTEPSKLFCKNVSVSAAGSIQSVMETDIFAEIINAFNNGTALNINVKYNGDASYANTLTDGQGNSYAYNLSADFSAKNSGVNFLCYFGGHTHWDAIWRHPTYANQIQVTSMEQGFQELTASDIQKNRSAAGGFGYNSILCASIDTPAKSVSLLKVGNQRTIDGRLRDFEILNLS